MTAQYDHDWFSAWEELLPLHCEKSATYGDAGDRLSNFTRLAQEIGHGQPPERYVAERMFEKLHRALNMLDRGDGALVKEWPDLASLALCAEALRRRMSP